MVLKDAAPMALIDRSADFCPWIAGAGHWG
jgi:hypothetical protein